uniref:Uncharacterized protein n=1 Tax=Caenorhabditis japonica TaxID=281687 RepID=A0A8R1E829_CAEJA
MELSIEIDGVEVDRTIPNNQATVLFLFLEKETWTTSEVVDKLKLPFITVKRRLEWLVKQGFVTVNPITNSDTWQLTRNPSAILPNRPGTPDIGEDDDVEPEENSDMVDALEQYWNYTRNYIVSVWKIKRYIYVSLII